MGSSSCPTARNGEIHRIVVTQEQWNHLEIELLGERTQCQHSRAQNCKPFAEEWAIKQGGCGEWTKASTLQCGVAKPKGKTHHCLHDQWLFQQGFRRREGEIEIIDYFGPACGRGVVFAFEKLIFGGDVSLRFGQIPRGTQTAVNPTNGALQQFPAFLIGSLAEGGVKPYPNKPIGDFPPFPKQYSLPSLIPAARSNPKSIAPPGGAGDRIEREHFFFSSEAEGRDGEEDRLMIHNFDNCSEIIDWDCFRACARWTAACTAAASRSFCLRARRWWGAWWAEGERALEWDWVDNGVLTYMVGRRLWLFCLLSISWHCFPCFLSFLCFICVRRCLIASKSALSCLILQRIDNRGRHWIFMRILLGKRNGRVCYVWKNIVRDRWWCLCDDEW